MIKIKNNIPAKKTLHFTTSGFRDQASNNGKTVIYYRSQSVESTWK
jgi:hypothetical protein